MITVNRFCNSSQGTFGEVMQDGELLGYSVEQPWNNNLAYHSCIPAGNYKLVNHDGTKHHNTFAFYAPELDVRIEKYSTGRFACVIHPANTADELQGCMAFGKELTCIDGKWAVNHSEITTDKILTLLRDTQQHELTINWSIP